ncbi:MAG TPA: histidine phosphatase family protein [Actinomycetota bacterium]|nr:histidine phosphatase family protein [Actinomycetota bacterium]
MPQVYLVRHGATEWNQQKLAQGHADIPLDEEGVAQAHAAARSFFDIPLGAVFSSDLIRAIDTATAIAEPHNLTVIQDPAFREIDQGEWEGLHVEEIRRRWPDLWGPSRHFSPRPGGETPQQVRARGLEALGRAVVACPSAPFVVVSHGGTIRWICAEALGYDDRRSARLRGLGNGGIVSIEATMDGSRLVLSNLHRLDGNTPDLDDPND